MITFCIPSKNNLRYLKTCIQSIRTNSHYDTNDILVYVDQDNDGTEDWLKENNIPYILNTDKECKGIGHAYDVMFKESYTDLVVAFHADMILGPNADYHLVDYHKRGTVVCATRIEPPLHPPGPEKVVMDFGMWPEDIKWEEFESFVKTQAGEKVNITTKGLFAPWLIHKDDHLGHDPIFLSVFEDADLFRRFKLAGYETIQSWSSYVYHLTCRGGQFEHAKVTEDLQVKSRSIDWQKNNQISLREYIRKWGGMFKEYGPCEPRPNTKYNVGLILEDSHPEIVAILEPFFDKLIVDCDCSEYIRIEQPNTKFDLASKFVNELNTDIAINYKLNSGNLKEFMYIVEMLEELITQAEPNSAYEVGPATLTVFSNIPTSMQLKL